MMNPCFNVSISFIFLIKVVPNISDMRCYLICSVLALAMLAVTVRMNLLALENITCFNPGPYMGEESNGMPIGMHAHS